MVQITWKEKLAQRARLWIKNALQYVFKITVEGSYQPSTNAVIIANRTSIIDALLLSVFLPERLTLALHPRLYKKLWVKMLLLFADVIVIDPAKALATRHLIQAIKSGKRCIIFPQGLSDDVKHSLKVFDGPSAILQKVGAEVIPIRIEGAEYSIFSINKNKNHIRLFPKITLHIMPAQSFVEKGSTSEDRYQVSLRLFRLISSMVFANSFHPKTLFNTLIDGAYLGRKHKSRIEDSNRTPLSYRQFIARCFILGNQIKKQTQAGEYVGVMMPTTVAGMVTFFALQAYRRIPAMINFSSGFYNVQAACQSAGIKIIYTSQQFVATAKLESLIEEITAAGIKVVYLEDFRPAIHLGNKLSGLLKGYFPTITYRLLGERISPHATGVILFTSGSEGKPKGVALSHANLFANCCQMASRVDFSSKDIFFNSLPIFHCFGLTVGSVFPLSRGLSCFFYPSPLHYKIIPGLVYQTGATIMLGTDTFLTGYARAADRNDFSSIRYIFAGAEKVKPETIIHWTETFSVKIFEGYGATETAPVISLNCPLASTSGSVGMILPNMESRIAPVDGIAEGGRLFLRGPNVMCGYLSTKIPGALENPIDGWHDTGDIVTMDDQGFITIIGRAKRFAKIAGEMVSLSAVEGIAASIWPDVLHAAITTKSSKKGEGIILFTEAPSADKSQFIKQANIRGFSELLVPQNIYPISAIPVLTSGKIDYPQLEVLLGQYEKTPEPLSH